VADVLDHHTEATTPTHVITYDAAGDIGSARAVWRRALTILDDLGRSFPSKYCTTGDGCTGTSPR
jgi:hypothetical protein